MALGLLSPNGHELTFTKTNYVMNEEIFLKRSNIPWSAADVTGLRYVDFRGYFLFPTLRNVNSYIRFFIICNRLVIDIKSTSLTTAVKCLQAITFRRRAILPIACRIVLKCIVFFFVRHVLSFKLCYFRLKWDNGFDLFIIQYIKFEPLKDSCNALRSFNKNSEERSIGLNNSNMDKIPALNWE